MVRTLKHYGDVELRELASKAFSFRQLLKLLGVVPAGGNYQTLKQRLINADISTKHFVYKVSTVERKSILLLDILVLGSVYPTNRLKNRLIKNGIFERKCAWCKLTLWNKIDIPLELDHVNGCRDDNRIENLRLLCPNCHAQTPTYRGKNTKRIKQLNNCTKCGGVKSNRATLCSKCFHTTPKTPKTNVRATKIVWKTPNEVSDLVKAHGYVGAGNVLGVSDNAVRKFLNRNLTNS